MIKEQKGKTWYLADGRAVAREFVPPISKIEERSVTRIVKAAEKAIISIKGTRQSLVSGFEALIEQLKKENKYNPDQARYSIFAFNKQFKIEMDINDHEDLNESYFRIYVATKEVPTSKDYKLLPIELNADYEIKESGEEVPEKNSDRKEEGEDIPEGDTSEAATPGGEPDDVPEEMPSGGPMFRTSDKDV